MTTQCHSSSPPLKHHHHRHLCCFGAGFVDESYHRDPLAFESSGTDSRSPSCRSWLRSTAQNLPEIRYRCRRLIGRSHRKAGHGGSAEFRYDPLSYALNFENDWSRDYQDEESPIGNFLARLPATPDRRAPVNLKCVTAEPGLL